VTIPLPLTRPWCAAEDEGIRLAAVGQAPGGTRLTLFNHAVAHGQNVRWQAGVQEKLRKMFFQAPYTTAKMADNALLVRYSSSPPLLLGLVML